MVEMPPANPSITKGPDGYRVMRNIGERHQT
jgi:hypothetical protein